MSYRIVLVQDETAVKFQQYLTAIRDADSIDRLRDILWYAYGEKCLDMWLYERLKDFAASCARCIETHEYFLKYYC